MTFNLTFTGGLSQALFGQTQAGVLESAFNNFLSLELNRTRM